MKKLLLLIFITITSSYAMELSELWNTTGTFVPHAEEEGVYAIYRILRDRSQCAPLPDIRTSEEINCRKRGLSKSAGYKKDVERRMSHAVVVSSPGVKRRLQNKAISLTGTKKSAQILLEVGLNTLLLKAYVEAYEEIKKDPSTKLSIWKTQEALKESWTQWRLQCIDDEHKHYEFPDVVTYLNFFNPLIYDDLKKQFNDY